MIFTRKNGGYFGVFLLYNIFHVKKPRKILH